MFRPQNFQKFEIFRKYWWFWPKICYFSPKWTKILTFKVSGGLKFSANHKKNFFRPKYDDLWPATKNRPEISISGHILTIFILSLESKNCQIWRKFWLSMWPEVRNFGRIWKKNFSGQNMMSCGRLLKIGQKFLCPAIFCSFYKFLTFSILGHFSPKWTKILTFKVAGGLKFSANHKKNFFRPKYVKLCPATKNRPEISISGHILTIFVFFTWIKKSPNLTQSLTFDMAGGQKFRPNLKKKFFRPKYDELWPATKNRPEISISGHILLILPIFDFFNFRPF